MIRDRDRDTFSTSAAGAAFDSSRKEADTSPVKLDASSDATVYVVDDNEMVRASLRTLLEWAGHRVSDFASAGAFLENCAARRGDCLLVDMRMPEMTGLELQAELVRRGIAVPVIIITGYADVALVLSGMKAGVVDFIEKPCDNEVLLETVKRTLASGRHARAHAVEAKAAEEAIALLTEREREVLERLVLGQSNKVVAYELGISPRTIEVHRAHIQQKMKARSLSDMVRVVRTAQGELSGETKRIGGSP